MTSAYLPTTPPEPAPLLFGYAVRARKAFFRNSAGLLASDNFFEVIPRRPEETSVLFALLNSVVAALHLEAHGRGQGRGLLKIQRYELAGLQLPDPARMDPVARRVGGAGRGAASASRGEGIRAALITWWRACWGWTRWAAPGRARAGLGAEGEIASHGALGKDREAGGGPFLHTGQGERSSPPLGGRLGSGALRGPGSACDPRRRAVAKQSYFKSVSGAYLGRGRGTWCAG